MPTTLAPIISDLALILVLAGVTTLLFKWLKQPVILGYILAGFLASPHFSFTPSITDANDIDIWADIGIIVLLFCRGLEFNFKKLVNVGGSAAIAALTIICGMITMGFAVGAMFNFTWINSLFLGTMLSMSSTTIIIKALTDLNMRKQKFTTVVFGVLVMEDLFAIIMMVLLSSIAVSSSFEGGELVFSILKLIFFLVICFLVGVYLIPTFFKKNKRYLNQETMLILSMGMCLAMVALATYSGFSEALGAFLMGTILAGTNEAERIEKIMEPIKNLFGAIFFVSVGMLVDPAAIAEYYIPIIVLSVVVIVGQIVFGTGGLLISGQPVKIAVQSGFCLTQIGEFAFIVATLGMSLNVIEPYIYPIVVAVSVITTFTTPYFIKAAEPASGYLERKMPRRIKDFLSRYSEKATQIHTRKSWGGILRSYIAKVAIYAIILIAIIILANGFIIPLIQKIIPNHSLANHLSAIIVLLIMSPFLWALMLKPINNKSIRVLVYDSGASPVPFLLLVLFRFATGLFLAFYLIASIYPVKTSLLITLLLFPVLLILSSKPLKRRLLEIEEKFFNNLNEREFRRSGKNNSLVRNMHIAEMDVKDGCPFLGRTLGDANIRQQYGVNVISIKRGNKRYDMPKRNNRILPGDVISVVGTDKQIAAFLEDVEKEAPIEETQDEKRFFLGHYQIAPDSSIAGMKINETQFRQNNCLVVGIETADGDFMNITGETRLNPGDTIWIVGEKNIMEKLLE